MSFDWSSFLNGLTAAILGSIVGGIIAFFIAKWTLEKTLKSNSGKFILSFLRTKVFIVEIIKVSQEISTIYDNENFESDENQLFRVKLNLEIFHDYILKVFKLFDEKVSLQDINDERVLNIIEKAPVNVYIKALGFFVMLISLYNKLVDKHPEKEKIPKITLEKMGSSKSYKKVLKYLKRYYRKLNKKLKF